MTMHTFTVRTLKITTFIGGPDRTSPPPDDANIFVLQGDFLLNGNLRVPGEAKIDLAPGTPFFTAPPPQIEIALAQEDAGPLFTLMLADLAPGGFVINFETDGDLTIPINPPFPGTQQLSRFWITFLRALA